MKRFFKILGKVILVIVLLFVALLIYVMNMDYTPTEDYGEVYAELPVYHGVCNDEYKGHFRVYVTNDTIYEHSTYNSTERRKILKNEADMWKEIWADYDEEVEAQKRLECVEKGKARQREFNKKQRKQEKREKEVKEAIETLLDN